MNDSSTLNLILTRTTGGDEACPCSVIRIVEQQSFLHQQNLVLSRQHSESGSYSTCFRVGIRHVELSLDRSMEYMLSMTANTTYNEQ
jgi:hypothetical protein